jgi:hypothetical protein
MRPSSVFYQFGKINHPFEGIQHTVVVGDHQQHTVMLPGLAYQELNHILFVGLIQVTGGFICQQ